MYRALLATLLVGCYSPSYDNCSITCGSTAHDTVAGSDAAPGDGSAATGCAFVQDVADAEAADPCSAR